MSKSQCVVVLTLMAFGVATSVAQDGPLAAQSADALEQRVRDALRAGRVAGADRIRIEARDGVLQLSGFVDSEDILAEALQTAKSVRGVVTVRNDLLVRDTHSTAGQAADDTVIAARVRQRIRSAVAADADIHVVVSDGVVQLSGYADSAEVKNRAADVASAVVGVQDVRNHIALE
jgi:hyperosmotically inducible protein